MPNKDEKNQSESTENELPRHAGRKHDFDEDTEEAFKLPKVMPEVKEDDDADVAVDKKKADADFDDVEIDVDEDELKAESESQPPGRKY